MSQGNTMLVAGLGNPGKKYEKTRHNIGFMVLDEISEEYSIPLAKSKFDTVFGRGKISGRDIVLVKPMAYMNRSGPPIQKLAHYFGIESKDIIVVYDDIDLEFGRLKLKVNGGHGGHNGLRSLVEALGTKDFSRLRVGIGRPKHSAIDVSDHVLGRFSGGESRELTQVISKAKCAVVTVLCNGISIGMNKFNCSI